MARYGYVPLFVRQMRMPSSFEPRLHIRASCMLMAYKNGVRPIQTACIDTAPHEKEQSNNDPDMFISDIKNPFEKKKEVCIVCKYKIPLDYKNPRFLSQFVSPYTGFVYDKHITGLCDGQQIRLVKAIKKSRDAGFMTVETKEAKYLRDPKLFDPFAPSRPNPH